MHLPPIIASLLTVAFIIFLFRRDIREKPKISGALWIPLIWFLIITTRAISEWLNLFGSHIGAVTLEEGSPLDACVYFVLIAAGLYILHQRQVSLSEIIRNNQWLTIFLLYCFISIIWSDFPFVAFKRWIKILGHPIMALIVLTEPDPEEALTRLMKRCAYIIVPVSILFIKYYPQLGRGFEPWSGAAVNTGITANKNALGCDCLILGFFFCWHLLQTWRTERTVTRRNELVLIVGFLAAIWWLLSGAQSSTSFMSLLLGVLTIALLGLRFVNKRLIGTYVVTGIVICVLAEATFGISGRVIELLGKSSTLTDRTVLWEDVLKVKINPIFGAGFESFWLGGRFQEFAESRWWQPNQAHNGYLETYLNLGLVGLFLLVSVLIATFWKSRRELLRNFDFGRFRLGFLMAVIAYNWTEASFKTLHPIWFVFYLIALDYRQPEFGSFQQTEAIPPEEDEKLVYAEGEIDGSPSDFCPLTSALPATPKPPLRG
jgi:exopolysaccharide production protein ExoQ